MTSSAFGDNLSSLSKKFTYSPVAYFKPKFRAADWPAWSCDKMRILSGYDS